jgi:hypothetical protein
MMQQFDRDFAAIKGPALLFIFLELADGLLTMWATNHGFVELNQLVAGYAQLWLYPASKVITALIGTIAVGFLAKRFPRYARIGLIIAAVFMAVVLVSNLYEMGSVL